MRAGPWKAAWPLQPLCWLSRSVPLTSASRTLQAEACVLFSRSVAVDLAVMPAVKVNIAQSARQSTDEVEIPSNAFHLSDCMKQLQNAVSGYCSLCHNSQSTSKAAACIGSCTDMLMEHFITPELSILRVDFICLVTCL